MLICVYSVYIYIFICVCIQRQHDGVYRKRSELYIYMCVIYMYKLYTHNHIYLMWYSKTQYGMVQYNNIKPSIIQTTYISRIKTIFLPTNKVLRG